METKKKIVMGIISLLLIVMGIGAYNVNENNKFQDQVVKYQLCNNATFLVYITGLNESPPHQLSNYSIIDGDCKGPTEWGIESMEEGIYGVHVKGPDVQSLNVEENRIYPEPLKDGSFNVTWISRNFTAIREN